MLRSLRRASFSLASFGLALLAASAATAQTCPGAGNTFWKRDGLPAVPSGLTAVGLVQGVCEGEAIGVVFEMPASMSPQKVLQVTAPWGAVGGTNGFQAQLDVQIYDGVSFTAGIPNMGTLVFDLEPTGSAMQVDSHALNSLDVSTYDIVVGLAPATGTPPVRRFAVCFRCDFNAHPTGSCASGWPANFFTDAQASFGTCLTPLRTSLIQELSQGWRDMATLTIGGFPACPFAFNGTWCIRACTTDAFPASYTTIAAGCPGTLGTSNLISATLPKIGTNMLVIVNKMTLNLGIMLMGFTNYVPPLDLTFLDMPNCPLHTSFEFSYSLFGGGNQAVHTLTLPNDNSLLGLQLYQQALSFDPINTFGAVTSDAARLVIGL